MTDHAPTAKLLLIEDGRHASAGSTGMPVRRYRLARLRFEPRPEGESGRFEHLKRIYD
jgi:hypothetical protein